MTWEYRQHDEYPWVKYVLREDGTAEDYFHECDPAHPDDVGVTSYYYPDDGCWYTEHRIPANHCVGCGVRLADFQPDTAEP